MRHHKQPRDHLKPTRGWCVNTRLFYIRHLQVDLDFGILPEHSHSSGWIAEACCTFWHQELVLTVSTGSSLCCVAWAGHGYLIIHTWGMKLNFQLGFAFQVKCSTFTLGLNLVHTRQILKSLASKGAQETQEGLHVARAIPSHIPGSSWRSRLQRG